MSFTYRPAWTYYRLTVRQEKRRHPWSWYACLKEGGKLYNAYVGRSPTVTADRLQAVTQQLMDKARAAAVVAAGGKSMPFTTQLPPPGWGQPDWHVVFSLLSPPKRQLPRCFPHRVAVVTLTM